MLNAKFLREEITTKKNRLDDMVKEVVTAVDEAIDKKSYSLDINNAEISVIIPKSKLDILEDSDILNAFDNFMATERKISYVYRYTTNKNENGEEIGKIMFKEYNASDDEVSDSEDLSF